ncbi:MAG TPA: LamG domain-containing protein [Candidatus Eremiobacteraceae bacterium]|nr:LamG domain-containing protein [Candidatus Eremiobacteraceae bacterium]
MLKHLRFFAAIAAVAVMTSPAAATMGGRHRFVATMMSTKPIAYFRLESTQGTSEVGSATFASVGGATSAQDCAPIGVRGNKCLALNGSDAYVKTTQLGGIAAAASIMAWVDLSALPSKAGHIFYVAGESHYGNDLDLQFETDDVLRFYTAGGSNVAYTADPKTLLQTWHMVVATVDTVSGERDIYWDGKLAAHDSGGGEPTKTSAFSIGYTTVFPGRWFSGAIDEVALWDRALSAATVSDLYSSTK